MKWKILLLLFALFTLLISPINGKTISIENYSNEDDAKNFLSLKYDEICKLFDAMREATIDNVENEFDEVLNNYLIYKYQENITMKSVQIAEEARNYIKNVKTDDQQLIRELQSLNLYGSITQNIQYLIDLVYHEFKQNKICAYKNQLNCNLRSDDVQKIIRESLDPNELLHYWKELRQADGPQCMEYLKIYYERLLNSSITVGYKSPEDLYFALDDDKDIALIELDNVMEEMKPFYTNLHAYIRGKLRQLFGENTLSSTGSIPHHLIEKLLVSDIIREEPFDGPILSPEDGLNENYQNASKLVRLSDEFFQSMGFESLPSSFWFKYCKEIKITTENKKCENQVYDHTKDTAFRFCPHTTYGSYLQLHNDMTRLYYANEKRNLPYGLYSVPSFELYVRKATILAASTAKHIKRVGIFNDYFTPEPARLYRQAITLIFPLFINYAHYKLIFEILTQKIENDQINKRYWELMEKYAGIKPPISRNLDDFDLTEEFLKDLIDNKFIEKTESEFHGYQFYKELCTISGEYVDGNVEMPLENCDFSKSIEAGNVLRRLMSLGGSKPWRESIKEIIKGGRALKAEGLLKYYKSTNDLIQKENDKYNFPIGWNG